MRYIYRLDAQPQSRSANSATGAVLRVARSGSSTALGARDLNQSSIVSPSLSLARPNEASRRCEICWARGLTLWALNRAPNSCPPHQEHRDAPLAGSGSDPHFHQTLVAICAPLLFSVANRPIGASVRYAIRGSSYDEGMPNSCDFTPVQVAGEFSLAASPLAYWGSGKRFDVEV